MVVVHSLSPDIAAVYDSFPEQARGDLLQLRELVLRTADETEGVGKLEEALKWDEPSFLSKTGSTIRLGWRKNDPAKYRLYFNCKTKLVDTFREVYPEEFEFEGNRAMLFKVGEPVEHRDALMHCLQLALTYHKVKHLALLGA